MGALCAPHPYFFFCLKMVSQKKKNRQPPFFGNLVCGRPGSLYPYSWNEFKTREQIILKYFIARWGVQFSTCAPSLHIVNITNAQCSTAMVTRFLVLAFSDYVNGNVRLRRSLGIELSLDPEGKSQTFILIMFVIPVTIFSLMLLVFSGPSKSKDLHKT